MAPGCVPSFLSLSLESGDEWWPCLDVPDQPAIVRQYMRYTGQIYSGKNAAKVMMRALQMFVLCALFCNINVLMFGL